MTRERSSRRRRTPALEPATIVVAGEGLLSRGNLLTLGAVLALMAAYRLTMLAGDPGPPGSDPGNWLAFTRDLFGKPVKAAESMYFPVALVLLKGLMAFFSDLVAIKLLGVIASVSLAAPFFLIVRRSCSLAVSAGLTVGLLMAGYNLEMLTWGGYPQLLASAFLLAALFCLDEGLASGNRRQLLAAGGFCGAVAGTHHFVLLVLIATLAVYLPWMALRHRTESRVFFGRCATWVAASVIAGLLFLPWYLWYFSLMAAGGSLNANGAEVTRLGDVVNYVFSESRLIWLFLLAIAPLSSLLPWGGTAAARLRPLGVALVLAPLLVFALTEERRAFQLAQVGMLICLGTAVVAIEAFLGSRPVNPTSSVLKLAHGAALILVLTIVTVSGDVRFQVARDRNVSIDENARDALDWVRTQTPADSVFFAGGRDDLVNYAWWVEGYAQRASYYATDPDFLTFKQERQQTALATALIRPATSPAEARRLLAESGIDYLFIYKPSGGYFQTLVDKVPVVLSYENESFAVLRIVQDSAENP